MLIYKNGDASIPEKKNIVIMHVVNNLGYWGKGFVLALSNRYPNIKKKYKDYCDSYSDKKDLLGNVQTFNMGDCFVANLFAQNGIYSKTNPTPIDYHALTESLNALYDLVILHYKNNGILYQIQCPKNMGAGLARGSWSKIENIIIDCLINKPIELDATVFDFDGK